MNKRTAGTIHRFGIVLAALAGLASAPHAHAASSNDCKPASGAHFICGVNNVEDFAPVPGTHWAIGSDLAAPNTQGYLYLFDTARDTASAVKPSEIAIRPDTKTYPDCPGPVDLKIFGPHGLDLTRGSGPHRTLYAVNHGGRESVEVFTVDFAPERPKFTWVGCVVAPNGFWPDAVASLPDGGIVVTSLWDPTDPDRMNKLSTGQPVGALDEWKSGQGWSPVPGSEGMSGPNGVIASPDGKDIYVAVWSGKQLVRITRGETPEKKAVPTGILTDNVRWAPDGRSIFVGGQDATVKQVLECFESKAANCNVPFKVYRANPQTLKLTDIVKSGVYGVFGAGTGAIEEHNQIWVSSFRSDRIAIFPAKQ
jgi:DNA-binding beta-propeller fold protein YncE